jgi:hypothetical protein
VQSNDEILVRNPSLFEHANERADLEFAVIWHDAAIGPPVTSSLTRDDKPKAL